MNQSRFQTLKIQNSSPFETVTNLIGYYYDGGKYSNTPTNTSNMTISNSYGLYIKQPTVGTNRVTAFFGGYAGVNMLVVHIHHHLSFILCQITHLNQI